MSELLSQEEQKFFESGGQVSPEPESVVEEAKAPEVKEAPKIEPDKFEEIKSNLNSALKQSREEKKALEEKLAKMEGTFQEFLKRANNEPEPKYEDDPLGFLERQNKALQDKLGGVEQKLSKFDEQEAQQTEFQRLVTTINAAETNFRSSTPQYDAAVKFLKDVRRQDIMDLGFSKEHAEAALQQEIIQLSKAALANGKDPAAAAYSMAKRYGFKEPQTEDKLKTIAKGQEAAKTVQGGQAAGISLAALSEMDGDQLDAIIKDDAKWNRLIRGQSIQ